MGGDEVVVVGGDAEVVEVVSPAKNSTERAKHQLFTRAEERLSQPARQARYLLTCKAHRHMRDALTIATAGSTRGNKTGSTVIPSTTGVPDDANIAITIGSASFDLDGKARGIPVSNLNKGFPAISSASSCAAVAGLFKTGNSYCHSRGIYVTLIALLGRTQEYINLVAQHITCFLASTFASVQLESKIVTKIGTFIICSGCYREAQQQQLLVLLEKK